MTDASHAAVMGLSSATGEVLCVSSHSFASSLSLHLKHNVLTAWSQ